MPSLAHSFVGYGSNFFAIPYLLRAHHVSKAEIGTVIGLTAAVAAWMGILIGGLLADKLKQKWEHGRLWVGLFSILASIPFAAGVYFSPNLSAVYVYNFFALFFSPMFIGPAYSTVNDLVPPHVRGTASAICLMMVTFIGLAMGPFTMGLISTAYAKRGMAVGPALRLGVSLGLPHADRGLRTDRHCVLYDSPRCAQNSGRSQTVTLTPIA